MKTKLVCTEETEPGPCSFCGTEPSPDMQMVSSPHSGSVICEGCLNVFTLKLWQLRQAVDTDPAEATKH